MPTPHWNDTFAQGDDWSNINFIGMFWSAMVERDQVINGIGGTVGMRQLAIGDDVQTAVSAYPITSIGYVQQWLEGYCSTFAPLTFNFTSPPFYNDSSAPFPITPDPFALSITSWRAAAGINASGFRRKRPREVASILDTNDTQGNSCSVGSLAFAVHSANLHEGMLYRYNGFSWDQVDPATNHPDILDSNSAAPNHVAYGLIRPGDYIGPWLFTEMRNGFNQLQYVISDGVSASVMIARFNDFTGSPAFGTSITTQNISGQTTGTDVTWAAAIADATSNFSSPGGDLSQNIAWIDVVTEGTSGTRYQIVSTATRWGWKVWLQNGNTPTITGTINVYVAFDAPPSGAVRTFFANGVQDAAGTTVTAGATYRMATLSNYNLPASGQITDGLYYGGNAGSVSLPGFSPTAPASDESYGYHAYHPRFVIDFTVSGGFFYNSSTP